MQVGKFKHLITKPHRNCWACWMKVLLRRTFITTTKKKERKLVKSRVCEKLVKNHFATSNLWKVVLLHQNCVDCKQTFNTKERKLVKFLLHYIAHWQGPCQKLSKNVSENKDQWRWVWGPKGSFHKSKRMWPICQEPRP